MQLDHPAGARPRADINVTPLIDIVLVLLIIFMVLTPTLMKHHTVQIPRESRERDYAPPQPLVVGYTADRRITINSEPVAWEQFAERLGSKLRHRARKVVFFRPEQEASYGEVVRLMDISRGAGAGVLAVEGWPHH